MLGISSKFTHTTFGFDSITNKIHLPITCEYSMEYIRLISPASKVKSAKSFLLSTRPNKEVNKAIFHWKSALFLNKDYPILRRIKRFKSSNNQKFRLGKYCVELEKTNFFNTAAELQPFPH